MGAVPKSMYLGLISYSLYPDIWDADYEYDDENTSKFDFQGQN